MSEPEPPLPLTGLTREDANCSGAAVDTFIGVLGGRARLTEILRIGAGDPAVDRVLDLLDEPLYGGWSLPKLCVRAGVSVADFLRAYQRAMLAVGEIAATKVIADGIVPVVADLMRRAAPYEVPCDCTLTPPTTVPPPVCKTCRGRGVRTILPDLDRQKIALALAKLLLPGGPVLQQTTQIVHAPAASGGTLANLHAAVREILHPTRRLGPAPAAPPTLPRPLDPEDRP